MPIAPSPNRIAPPAADQLTVAKPTEPPRALTAVRGLAAWWVVGFHFRESVRGAPAWIGGILASGYLAVDLFFILSGYVIALNYAGWFVGVRFNSGMYRRFLALRLSRIYPLHLAILLAFLVNPLAAFVLTHHGTQENLRWGYFGLSLLLMQEWGFSNGLAWNVPAWSISAEWLAYLVFPFLAVSLAVAAGTRARALGCVAMLLITLGVIVAAGSPTGLGYDAEWFGLTRCVFEFSVGLCLATMDGHAVRSRTVSNLGLALAAACLFAFVVWSVPDFVIMPLGFAALITALMDERGTLAGALRTAPLQWLGVVSYSTYLSHYLLKTWVKFALVRPGVPERLVFPVYLAMVLFASAVLHIAIERPGQRYLRGWLVRPAGSVPA